MIQVIMVVAVYVLGPALILTWVVKRYRSGVKPDFTEMVAVVFAIALVGLLIYSYSNMVTDTDREDVQRIVAELTKRYPFPVKAKYEDRPAVDGVARARYLEIRIYGVTSEKEQDKIADLARKIRRQVASKSIVLMFFREEVWEVSPEGARRPLREQEDLLRKIRIE